MTGYPQVEGCPLVRDFTMPPDKLFYSPFQEVAGTILPEYVIYNKMLTESDIGHIERLIKKCREKLKSAE